MAAAVPSSIRRAASPGRPRPAMGGGRVRWDRIGRVALLLVLGLILLLYVGPARSFVSTWRDAKEKRADVHRLTAENRRLQARRRALEDPRTLEAEARKLGMVRPGERAFVVQGLGRR
ncbi:MAG: septum formation initiator family protein [Actinomycetota bacterium]|nr:septum formation initiator family protein [Actinomycetota bacterium]